jgi:hypothetical protein
VSLSAQTAPRLFAKETLIKGRPGRIECVDIGGQTYVLSPGPLTVAALEDEWYEDVADPEVVIRAFRAQGRRPDIFSFWQRLPDTEVRHPYYFEWEEIAALRVQSHEHWWNHQIGRKVRALIRKGEKQGLVVRETSYDDDFVRGMTAIFNEAPIRQGRPFWHYGKDFETVKKQFSRYLHREYMIGAYYEGEMVGFLMLGNAGRCGITGQIISSIRHRDKGTTSALISKAVEVCEERQLDYLVYVLWGEGSLSEFKQRCGFERTRVPRYFVPLTWKGALGFKLGAHRGWTDMVPSRLKAPLKQLRASWYQWRERS